MAKILRKELKNKFPKTKFSVTTENYTGGCSINVDYTNGPALKEVDDIANKYQGKSFDGMIDMAYYIDLYIDKDGYLNTYKSLGTEDSKGYCPSFENNLPKGAEFVETSHPYVFVNREYTKEIKTKLIKKICKDFGVEYDEKNEHNLRIPNSCEFIVEKARKVLNKKDLSVFNDFVNTDVRAGDYEEMIMVI